MREDVVFRTSHRTHNMGIVGAHRCSFSHKQEYGSRAGSHYGAITAWKDPLPLGPGNEHHEEASKETSGGI